MSSTYIPALRFHWLTSWYDPLVRLTTRERTFKSRLVGEAQIASGDRVLDLGCGTGTLALQLKQVAPTATVIGLDGDPKILDIARRKAGQAEADIEFKTGLSFELPLADESFDHVFSTLFFHHLAREDKARTLREAFRVLRPGGALHIGDWGKAQNPVMRTLFLVVQLLDGFATTADNVDGLVPSFVRDAGFAQDREIVHYMTMLGTISLLTARKPETGTAREPA